MRCEKLRNEISFEISFTSYCLFLSFLFGFIVVSLLLFCLRRFAWPFRSNKAVAPLFQMSKQKKTRENGKPLTYAQFMKRQADELNQRGRTTQQIESKRRGQQEIAEEVTNHKATSKATANAKSKSKSKSKATASASATASGSCTGNASGERARARARERPASAVSATSTEAAVVAARFQGPDCRTLPGNK